MKVSFARARASMEIVHWQTKTAAARLLVEPVKRLPLMAWTPLALVTKTRI
jgi:hypothetical protein